MVQDDFWQSRPGEKLEELRKKEAEDLAQILATKYGLPYLNLSVAPINAEALRVVEESAARLAGLAPFGLLNKKIRVGILTPNNQKTQELLEELKRQGWQPEVFLVGPESLERVWSRYGDLRVGRQTEEGTLQISDAQIVQLLGQVRSLEEIKKKIRTTMAQKTAGRTSRTLEIILAGALLTKASDIHFEPEENYVRLRYRLDGILTDVLNFEPKIYNSLLTRIKLLSGLKLNITDKAQDGRLSIKLEKDRIEIRTSVLPGSYNESVVLRVLNPSAISVPLEELGINQRLMEILLKEIGKPNGLILTTGPTGSGKTTTLYAFLKKIHQPGIKIITIENPIEYRLPGVVQTQTDKNYSFLDGLRSALRQDPDVIMVGEIRDRETAEIAVNAALTGHLVFSTMHTNNAAGSFPRLIDLGINPKVLTSAINLAMAQRLVRKLCEPCRQKVKLTGPDLALIETVLRSIRRKDESYLENIRTEFVWRAGGCSACHNSGFKGRTGIFEAVLADDNIERIVTQNPSDREIRRAAAGQKILDITQDGVLKVLAGQTSLEELRRVVELEVE